MTGESLNICNLFTPYLIKFATSGGILCQAVLELRPLTFGCFVTPSPLSSLSWSNWKCSATLLIKLQTSPALTLLAQEEGDGLVMEVGGHQQEGEDLQMSVLLGPGVKL